MELRIKQRCRPISTPPNTVLQEVMCDVWVCGWWNEHIHEHQKIPKVYDPVQKFGELMDLSKRTSNFFPNHPLLRAKILVMNKQIPSDMVRPKIKLRWRQNRQPCSPQRKLLLVKHQKLFVILLRVQNSIAIIWKWPFCKHQNLSILQHCLSDHPENFENATLYTSTLVATVARHM